MRARPGGHGASDGTASTVTLLSDPPPGAATTSPPVRPAPARPASARRAAAGAGRPRSSALRRAVTAAIGRLHGGDRAAVITVRQHIDRTLRDALTRHLESAGDDGAAAVPAVRVACAHLAANDLEDAYLALLTARDLLR